MDYLLELLALDDAGLRPPIIAAGINLFGGPLGLIHRHVTGALPIRRNTKDPAYHITLKAYVAELLRTQDFFFYPEGGRSYSGEIKSPKTGLLTACLQSAQPNLVIVPVSIAYDLVLEDHVLARQKVKRSQRAFSREVAEMVRYAVGYRSRAFVTFGAPIAVDDFNADSRTLGARPRPSRDGAHRPAGEGAADGAHGRGHGAVDSGSASSTTASPPCSNRSPPPAPTSTPRTAAAVVAAAAEPLEARGIIARDDGPLPRARAQPAPLLRADDRAPAAVARGRHALMLAATSKAALPRAGAHRPAAPRRLALRHGSRLRLRAPLHRRRDHRRGDRGGARARRRGFGVSLDYLGESVATLELADQAARDYLRLVEQVVESGIERNLSLKLTQLGLDVDRATAIDNLRRVLEAGRSRTGSSCASTWRTRRTPTPRSTSSRRCGASATPASAR